MGSPMHWKHLNIRKMVQSNGRFFRMLFLWFFVLFLFSACCPQLKAQTQLSKGRSRIVQSYELEWFKHRLAGVEDLSAQAYIIGCVAARCPSKSCALGKR